MIQAARRAMVAIGLAATAATALAQSSQTARVSFPTSQNGAAQAAFVRGIIDLHNFEYDEAILAFREAQKLAPAFAMAYWGEALSYTQPLWYHEDLARAREVLARLGPTPAARSPASKVEFCHASGSASVRLATYFGTALRRAVKGMSCGAFGQ